MSALANAATTQAQAPVVGCKKVGADFTGKKAKVFFTRHIVCLTAYDFCEIVIRFLLCHMLNVLTKSEHPLFISVMY